MKNQAKHNSNPRMNKGANPSSVLEEPIVKWAVNVVCISGKKSEMEYEGSPSPLQNPKFLAAKSESCKELLLNATNVLTTSSEALLSTNSEELLIIKDPSSMKEAVQDSDPIKVTLSTLKEIESSGPDFIISNPSGSEKSRLRDDGIHEIFEANINNAPLSTISNDVPPINKESAPTKLVGTYPNPDLTKYSDDEVELPEDWDEITSMTTKVDNHKGDTEGVEEGELTDPEYHNNLLKDSNDYLRKNLKLAQAKIQKLMNEKEDLQAKQDRMIFPLGSRGGSKGGRYPFKPGRRKGGSDWRRNQVEPFDICSSDGSSNEGQGGIGGKKYWKPIVNTATTVALTPTNVITIQ